MNALEVREARFCSVTDSLLTPQERKQKMDYLYYVPDSVLTFEQSAIKKELIKTFKEEVAAKYIKVENNEMTFTMGKKEFLKTGLPETLYWEIKENIKTNNRFIKENGMVDIEESWQKTLLTKPKVTALGRKATLRSTHVYLVSGIWLAT